MKKILLIFVMLLIPSAVSAVNTCSTEEQLELKNAANLIKVSYEENYDIVDLTQSDYYDELTEEEKQMEYKTYYFDISILNITEDLYVEIENNINSEVEIIRYSDTDNGKYIYKWRNLANVATFTFTVKSSSNTNCEGEGYSIKYLTTPMYNIYADSETCIENPDADVCQRYISIKGFDAAMFNEYFEDKNDSEDDKDEENSSETGSFLDFIIDNKVYFIIGTLVVVIGVTTIVIVQKKRSKI